MKRIASALLALLLLFSLCACSSENSTPDELIEAGEYLEAYEKLEASEDPADQERLEDFWVVPISASEDNGRQSYVGTYEWNEETKTLTTKAVMGENERITTYVWEGNTVTFTSDYVTRIYTCNDEGYVIREQWRYEEDEPYSSIELEYDERNNLIKETTTIIGNDGPSTCEYIYDENDRLIKKTYANNGEVSEIMTYSYNENGKILREDSETTYQDYTYRTDYIYNDQGQLIRATKTCSDGTDPRESVFSYDNKGNLVEEAFYENGELSDTIVWTYNDQGRFLTQTKTSSNGNVKTLTVDGYTAYYLPNRAPAIDYIIGNFEREFILYVP